jgi:phosphate acetyltransferase
VQPVLIGSPARVETSAAAAGVSLRGVAVEDPLGSARRESCRAAVGEALRDKMRAVELDSLLEDPLYYAAAMVRAGHAEGSVAGARHTTAETLRAALRIIRPAPGCRVVSSFFLMALREPTAAGDELLAFADCGLVPSPTAEELVDIARRTADHFRLLAEREPRVAFLSFSTHASASSASVEKVRRAVELALAAKPDFALDGELQVDAALVPAVARAKAPNSPVAGRANVLIFPDLDAGNIGYKLVERLAGARAIGPILQGLSRPANDLSRGCSEDDVVVAAAITALQSTAIMRPSPEE